MVECSCWESGYHWNIVLRLTDQQIVNGLINNDAEVIRSFFFNDCSSLFDYILRSVFDWKADKNELISELFIYLSSNDWRKVKQFDYRSKLTTWLSVVAIRFFQKKRLNLIENESNENLIEKHSSSPSFPHIRTERRLDVFRAIERMPNKRYAKVIIALDIQDKDPECLAEEMGIRISNLYNIHKRAHLQLASIMKEKEDYYA